MHNYSDLTFRVAGFDFRIIFPNGIDGRYFLPSYAPFHLREGSDELLFCLRVGENISLLAEGEEIGQFDAYA